MNDMKLISIAVRDFALPVPRVGSIESQSGYGRTATEGQEIHLRIQRLRAEADPSYQSEVKILSEFDRGDYRFQIGGRIDGLFATDPPKLEEIKSSFNIY